MAKPFEITYSPASWNAPNGGVATSWTTPYGGLNVQAPENIIGPHFSPAINNFMLRNAALTSRPRLLRGYLPGPDGQNPILGLGSFLSPNLVWHTFAFTVNGLFQLLGGSAALAAAGKNPWVPVGTGALFENPIAFRVFQGVLYYSSGTHLSAWDGAALAPLTDVAFTGATNPPLAAQTKIGGLFLGELDNHLILGYTTETTNGISLTFPQRIRWSNNGFTPYDANRVFGNNLGTAGATWDPSININAGFDDFIDVPDIISGFMFIGRTGYIFRFNGVTEISPTGRGAAPFDVNHLWASERGIGNVFPDTIAQYGNMGGFVSTENVYSATMQGIQAIGGSARDAIMADLASTSGTPSGVIVPNLAMGFTYMVYMLLIPIGNFTRMYVYSFEDGNWTVWTFSQTIMGQPNNCWTGDVAVVGGGTAASNGPVGGGGGTSGGGTGGGGTTNPPRGGGFTGGGGGNVPDLP